MTECSDKRSLNKKNGVKVTYWRQVAIMEVSDMDGKYKLDIIDLFQNNSGKIQNGINWLKENIEYDEEEVKQKINELKDSEGSTLLAQYETWLKIKCNPADFLAIFALGLLDNQIVKDFKKCAEEDEFWDSNILEMYIPGMSDQFYFWNFLYEMGFSSNDSFLNCFNDFKNETTEGGRMWNDDEHVCFLRFAIALEPQSPITNKVLRYSLENNHNELDAFECSVFILGLTELDFYKYRETIEEGIKFIKTKQNEDGSWGEGDWIKYRYTYFAIRIICRVNGNNDEHLRKGIDFILKNQQSDGSWGHFVKKNHADARINLHIKNISQQDIHLPDKDDTSFALMSLLITLPPFSTSAEEYKFKEMLFEQEMNLQRPYFIHTSPIYNEKIHVKGIYDKIREILNNTNSTVRIISPYIDMLYEDVIDLKNKNPSLDIRIVTRPKKDINGMRARIAKNVLDLLDTATFGNLKTLEVIHSILIIIDDQELIISSADLTREGLYDEFNAGIYTKDAETIRNCINYFDNIWQTIPE